MGRMGEGARSAAALAVLLLVARSVPADTPPEDLYVRTPQSVAEAASAVVARAKERGAATVVVAFDVISFAPPPGAHEFSGTRFARDLDAWTSAFASRAKGDATQPWILFTTTGETDLTPANDPIAVARLTTSLRGTDWTSKRSPVAPAFADWAARTLSRVPQGKKALVLVGGLLLPENLDEGGPGPAPSEPWRRHLARPGEYWDEERVIATLARSDASFAVVAPEARFCDYLPVDDLPQVPWASRPVVSAFVAAGDFDPVDRQREEEELRRHLKETGSSDAEIERVVEEYRRQLSDNTKTLPGGRFDWATPRFCRRFGGRVIENTDCPSGFGWWPYARVAAATDGIYVRYPSSGLPWLDLCLRDEALMRTLAPTLGTRREWTSSRARDAAFGDMLAILAAVKDRPPWPQEFGPTSGGVWCGFESAGGGASADRRWRDRDLPCESLPLRGDADRDWSGEADRARAAAERYASAADRLARLAERLAAKPDAAPNRTDANVRLARFWCETSAFHLEALAICFEGIPKRPARVRGDGGEVAIAYTGAIRLSDCLDAYDGTRITDAEERSLRAPDFTKRDGAQSNFLILLMGDPRYRARRSFDAVTKNLDPRLLPRAKRMVAAAEAVMSRYAKTPWGWVVYYAEAATFVHEFIPGHAAPGSFGPPPPPDPSTPDSNPDGPRTPK